MGIYHKKYAFRVEIDGLTVAAFKTAGPLQANVSIVEENEGGSLAPTKELGRASFDNVVLTKGVTDNEELWGWMKSAISGVDADAEKDLAIVQTNRAGEEIKRWEIISAKPVRFKGGDWDGSASENTIEELELSIESFDLA
jgi:phage tail-like protein